MKKFKLLIGALVISFIAVGCSTQSVQTSQNAQVKEDSITQVENVINDSNKSEQSLDKLNIKIPTGWDKESTNEYNFLKLINKTKATKSFTPSITVTDVSENAPEDISQYVEDLKELEEEEEGITLNKTELIDMSFGQVNYVEIKSEINDEILDDMLKSGAITKKELEKLGGREAYIADSISKTIQIFMRKEDAAIIISGEYDDQSYEEVKQAVLDIAESIELK